MNMNAIYYKVFPALAVVAGFCSGCVTEQKESGAVMLENYVNRYIWPAESLHVTDYSLSDDYLRIYIEGETVLMIICVFILKEKRFMGVLNLMSLPVNTGTHRITAKAYRAEMLSFMEQSLR